MAIHNEVMDALKFDTKGIGNKSEKPNVQPNTTEMSGLQSTINNILTENWTMTDDFEFFFHNDSMPLEDVVGDANSTIRKCLVSVDVPILTAPEIDIVMGGERITGTRMFEMFRFSAKFRDYSGLHLRKYFMGLWMAGQYNYFDKIKSNITILNSGKIIFGSPNCIITSVSPITFDNNTTGIAEFDVQFNSTTYGDDLIQTFGDKTTVEIFDIDFEDNI